MRGTFFVAIFGICALVGSFLLTMWLTAPAPPQQAEPGNLAAATLAGYLVPNEAILTAAAKSVGLQRSDQLKGYIDEIARTNKEQVRIRGWVADPVGQGAPITVLVFADGRNTLGMDSKGARSDVAQALKLPHAAAANLAFAGEFFCNSGETLFIVAVTQNNSYAPLYQLGRPLICPS
jgi:hypothetical protein